MRKRQEAEEEAIHRRKLEDAEYQRQRQREQEKEARQAEQLAQQQQILEESRIKRKQSGATALADLGQLRDTLEGLIDQKQHAQDELDNIRRQIDSLNREIAAAPDNLATVEETLASQMAEEQLAKSLLSQARAGHQRTDIERMKLLTDLHASYTHIADNKEQTYAKLNDLKATQELYDGQLKKLQSKERDLDTQIKGLKSQLEDVQHSQQKVINRMKADAELLGLAEFTSPIFEKEAAS
jgi:chromosome segregation ATPase